MATQDEAQRSGALALGTLLRQQREQCGLSREALAERVRLLGTRGAGKSILLSRIALGHRATKHYMQLAFPYNPDRYTLTVRRVRDLTEEQVQQRKLRSGGKKKQTES